MTLFKSDFLCKNLKHQRYLQVTLFLSFYCNWGFSELGITHNSFLHFTTAAEGYSVLLLGAHTDQQNSFPKSTARPFTRQTNKLWLSQNGAHVTTDSDNALPMPGNWSIPWKQTITDNYPINSKSDLVVVIDVFFQESNISKAWLVVSNVFCKKRWFVQIWIVTISLV